MLREGTQLKRGTFIVTSLIGRGGFGEVYLARQPRMDRQVAIKVLSPAVGEDPDVLRRFEREALAAGSLLHPNVLPVFDFDFDEEVGVWFLAMQYVPGGRTLKDRGGEQISLAETARIVTPVASALDAAHARGIVHRDVKPANVLMDGDRPMLTDFGIAHLSSLTGLTGAGMAVGTPAYLSPEQGLGRPVGPQADQYSLGVMTFEMLTGRLPFTGDSVSLVMQHVNSVAPPLEEFIPSIPLGARIAVSRALSKNPPDRYSSCSDFARALLAEAPDATVGGRPGRGPALTETIDWDAKTVTPGAVGSVSPVAPTVGSVSPVAPTVGSVSPVAPTVGSGGDVYSVPTQAGATPETFPTPLPAEPLAPTPARGRLATGTIAAIAGAAVVVIGIGIAAVSRQLLNQESTVSAQPTAVPQGFPGGTRPTVDPRLGAVTLGSNPAAAIIVNGEPAGRTPRELQLLPGDYDLTLVAPTYQEWTTRVSLAEGQRVAIPPVDLVPKPAREVLQITDRRMGKDPVVDARGLIRLQTPSETFLLSDDIRAIIYVKPQTFGVRDLVFNVTTRWARPGGIGALELSGEQKVPKDWEETFVGACSPALSLDPVGSNIPITLDILIDDEPIGTFTFRISGGNPANAPPSQCDATAMPRTVAMVSVLLGALPVEGG